MKNLNTYLYENLKSHNYTGLCNLIYKEYKDDILYFDDYINQNTDKKSFIIKLKEGSKRLNYVNLIDKTKEVELFNRFIEFFNYGYNLNDKTPCTLKMDPIYPIEVSKIFKDKYNCQAYHFVDKENKDNILKCGLRTKDNMEYKNIPKRIYLYMSNEDIDSKTLDNIELLNIGLKNEMNKKYIAFKVDMSTLNYNVYQDARIDNDRAIFTYNNIPTKFLKLIES